MKLFYITTIFSTANPGGGRFFDPGFAAGNRWSTVYEHDCNLENVSQTILQSEFTGVFIATVPENVTLSQLTSQLQEALSRMGLSAYVKQIRTDIPVFKMPSSEPFVITTKGPDRKGLVAGITEVIAKFGVNVTNLQAVFRGGDNPDRNIMIYEVDVPLEIDRESFQWELRQRAVLLGLDINIQHRNIFEAINRI